MENENQGLNECNITTEGKIDTITITSIGKIDPKIDKINIKKKKPILLLIILLILFIIILITIIILIKKKEKCDKNDCKCNNNCPDICIGNCDNGLNNETNLDSNTQLDNEIKSDFQCESKNCPIFYFDYKKNDLYIYNEILTKNSKIELSNNYNKNERRLNEDKLLSKKKNITLKYLINIFNIQIEDSIKIYYAYVIIIDMKKKIENRDLEIIEENDIRESNEVNNTISVVNISFNENGILDFKINENMNKTLISYLYEFIEQVIPKITKESFNENSEEEKRTYEKNKEKIIIKENKKPKLYNDDENKEEQFFIIEIDKKRVKKVKSERQFELFVNQEKPLIGYSESNFTKDIENDENVNRGTLIKQITENIESTINLLNEENNEEITYKILDLLNNINFIEYNNNRKLNNIEKKLNNLRNLQETEIFTYSMPIHFNYPLFKSNLLGAKIGLITYINFNPKNGSFNIKMNFDANGKLYEVFSFEKSTNFNEIIENIQFIIKQIYIILVKDKNIVQPVLNEFELKIKEILDQFYNEIKILPQLNKEEFTNELKRIILIVNETTINKYNEIYESSIKANQEYNKILTDIQNNRENFVSSIKTISSEAVVDFIENNKNKLEILFNEWTKFYQNIIEELEENKKDLNNSIFRLNIGFYYNIKDEMDDIINIYKEYGKNIENSLRIEHEKFTSEVNEKFNIIIEPILLEAEKFAEEVTNNIYIIDIMKNLFNYGKGDEIRNNMINQINNLRTNIEKIKKEILFHISEIYT